jgi:hypothetical protein
MAKFEVVELANPIELFGKKVSTVKIKEPTGYQYSTIGEPRIMVHTGTGGGYFVEQPAEINRYLEGCIDHEQGADFLRLLSLVDAMTVKRALLGFFEGAEATILERKLTRSSSAPA